MKTQTPTGPAKYVDENGVARMTIKHESPRTPGSEAPHVELRDANGQRIDPFGNPVTQRSDGNHTPIERTGDWMIDYTQFPDLDGVYLEDSYVLAISEAPTRLAFKLLGVLTSRAPCVPRSPTGRALLLRQR